MAFQNRDEFINSAASEKIILAHVRANTRIINWTLAAGSIYVKTVNYFPIAIKRNDTTLTRVDSQGAMSSGTFYYNTANGEISIWLDDSSDPANSEIIVTYQLFFSNNPVSLPWDLSDDTELDVYYDGRITRAPGFKQRVGIEQGLNSVVGSGDLVLENNDGELDEIFDRFIFDNQEVRIYSWNRDLLASEAQIIFKGRITNKKYDSVSVSFTVKDTIFELQQNVPQGIFEASDGVNSNIEGQIKRWIYGRVDGLKLQSTDQIGEGYALTGTVAFTGGDKIMSGTGTSFLSETSPGDKITVETLELEVESVESDTSLTLTNTPDYAITGATAIIVPEIPTTNKNRSHFVADHATAQINTTVINALQFNRIQLASTLGLNAGDFITFQGTSERKEIKNVAPGNIVVLRDNVVTLPSTGSSVTREPVQVVYVNGKRLIDEDFTITNNTTKTEIVLDTDAEFNIAPVREFNLSMTFTNGSRTITYAGDQQLTEIFNPRDYIRPEDLSYTNWYEILSVSDTEITIRTTFTDPTITDVIEAKQPDYVGDDTIVSADVLGKTEDGNPTGTWIQTSSQVVKDLLTEAGITDIDTASFDEVESTVPQLVSMALPFSPSKSPVTLKTAIDTINRSTRCALTLDKNLTLKYESVLVTAPQSFVNIYDSDVVRWSIRSTNGKNYRNSIIRYRHKDVDNNTLESGNSVATFSSEFVRRYVGTNKTFEDDLYIYDDTAANIASEREIYYNSLGLSIITIETDLRLEGIEIGDSAVMDFERLYKRFGDAQTRRKLVTCVGKTVTGEKVMLEFSDYGNTYNTSAFITDNAALDFDNSNTDDKIRNGFITDPQGIVNDIEDTNKTNLIS